MILDWDEIVDKALEREEVHLVQTGCSDELEILARRVIGILYRNSIDADTDEIFIQQFRRLTSLDEDSQIRNYYQNAFNWWTTAYTGRY